MQFQGMDIKPSWILLTLAGALILAGLPGFWVGDFRYWAVTRLLYVAGVALFWWGR